MNDVTDHPLYDAAVEALSQFAVPSRRFTPEHVREMMHIVWLQGAEWAFKHHNDVVQAIHNRSRSPFIWQPKSSPPVG